MNYRHAFHAGNHADVLKHLVLTLVLARLAAKEKPFFVLDTHAGRGIYDLEGEAARRSPEFEGGIARLLSGELPPVFDDYRALVRSENPDRPAHGPIRWYPGSPSIIASSLRPGDAYVACERHPAEAAALGDRLGRRPGVRIEERDGYEALRALLPPPARRGLVLIDPPFEAPGEFDRLARALSDGFRRFAGGVFAVWYPIKDHVALRGFARSAVASGFAKRLTVELCVKAPADGAMAGSGLFIANPPFGLGDALQSALPVLAARLAAGPGGAWRLHETEGEAVLTDAGEGAASWL